MLATLETMRPGIAGGPVEAQLPTKPFCGIAFVGEAPGRDEVAEGFPFAGAAGQRLNRAMAAAGIDRAACLIANPFRYRPIDNKIGHFFASKARASAEQIDLNELLPSYLSGYCIKPHDDDVRTLWRILKSHEPRAIVAMGNTAAWAILWKTGITRLAGQVFETRACSAKVVATWHPSYLARRHSPEEDAAFESHLRMAREIAEGRL